MNRTSIVYSYRGRGDRSYLGMIAKRKYAIRPNSPATPVAEPALVNIEPSYAESMSCEAERLLHDTDLLTGLKPATDVVLRGSAYSTRGAVPALRTSLRVGPVFKMVQVFGDRRIELGKGGEVGFSRPQPFTSMALLWDHAFGGREIYVEEQLRRSRGLGKFERVRGLDGEIDAALSYMRNPAGRGFFLDVDRERLDGALAPNLEDPADPVSPDRILLADYNQWIDCPVAACYEPIDLFTFPRSFFMMPAPFGAPTRPIHEITIGALLPADLARMDVFDWSVDPRSYNCAAPGLGQRRLEGGERVALSNLHPKHELLEFDLPGDRPRLIIEPPNVSPREVTPHLQTVLFEPDEDRVTLTWAGALEVAMVFPPEMCLEMRHAVTWPR
jgi:hypothetical protein